MMTMDLLWTENYSHKTLKRDVSNVYVVCARATYIYTPSPS